MHSIVLLMVLDTCHELKETRFYFSFRSGILRNRVMTNDERSSVVSSLQSLIIYLIMKAKQSKIIFKQSWDIIK